MKRIVVLILVALLLAANSGCKVSYSFSGASIAPEVKTFTIQYLKNTAPLVKPTLSQQLTDALRDRFNAQTNLNQVNKGGDLNIEGEITGYATTPVAITGNQTAAMNRLTITVNIRFTNRLDEKQNFETSFSRFEDYPSSQPLAAVEATIVEQIISYLVDDIFNKAVVNW